MLIALLSDFELNTDTLIFEKESKRPPLLANDELLKEAGLLPDNERRGRRIDKRDEKELQCSQGSQPLPSVIIIIIKVNFSHQAKYVKHNHYINLTIFGISSKSFCPSLLTTIYQQLCI